MISLPPPAAAFLLGAFIDLPLLLWGVTLLIRFINNRGWRRGPRAPGPLLLPWWRATVTQNQLDLSKMGSESSGGRRSPHVRSPFLSVVKPTRLRLTELHPDVCAWIFILFFLPDTTSPPLTAAVWRRNVSNVRGNSKRVRSVDCPGRTRASECLSGPWPLTPDSRAQGMKWAGVKVAVLHRNESWSLTSALILHFLLHTSFKVSLCIKNLRCFFLLPEIFFLPVYSQTPVILLLSLLHFLLSSLHLLSSSFSLIKWA